MIVNNTSILNLSVYQIKQYAERNSLKVETEYASSGTCYVWFYTDDGNIHISAGAAMTWVRAYQNAFATLKDRLWQHCQGSWIRR